MDTKHAGRVVRLVACAMALLTAGPLDPAASARGVSRPQGIAADGETEVLVQSREAAVDANTVLELAPQQGGRPIQRTVPPIAPLGVGAVNLRDTALPDGTYAVAAYSDRHVAIVDRTSWPVDGGAIAGNAPAAGSEIVVPLVRKGPAECTLLSVQNVDTSTATTFDVALYSSDGGDPVGATSSSVGPGTSVTLSLCDDAAFEGLPEGFVGSAAIQGRSALVVGAITAAVTGAPAVHSHGGVPDDRAADRLVAPFVAADWRGLTALPSGTGRTRTEIVVVNVGDVDADVSVTYRGLTAPCAGVIAVHGDAPVRIRPRGMALLGQGVVADGSAGESGLPPGCVAAANVTAPGGRLAGAVVAYHELPGSPDRIEWAASYDLMAVVLEGASIHLPFAGKRRGAAAGSGSAVSAGVPGLRALVPRIERRPPAVTWVFVANLAAREVRAVLAVYGADGKAVEGCGAYCAATLAPLSGHVWATPWIEAYPEGEVGRAEVLADGPIAVTVLEVSGTSDLSAYNAVPPARGAGGSAERLPFAVRTGGAQGRD